jgi:hypothetical protein
MRIINEIFFYPERDCNEDYLTVGQINQNWQQDCDQFLFFEGKTPDFIKLKVQLL